MSTAAKVQQARTPVDYSAIPSGSLRRPLELEVIDARLTDVPAPRTFSQAKIFIRLFPRRWALFLRLVAQHAPDRLPVIIQESEAVLEGCDDAVLGLELERAEELADGEQDVRFLEYRHATGDERERLARAAAHACFRHSRLLHRQGRAILRAEGLAH